jgi:DNA-binding NarL/FixJ family response regulator
MNPIRVLIVAMPQLMTDIVEQTIELQPDIEVAGIVRIPGDIARAMRRGRVDVVLCRLDGSELPPVYRELFDTRPHLRLLAVEADDRTGSIYELRPARAALDVWPTGLIDAIRAASGSTRSFRWNVDDR